MYENYNSMTYDEAKVYLGQIYANQELIQPHLNFEQHELWLDLNFQNIKPIYKISNYGRVLNMNSGNILKQSTRNVPYPWYLTLGLQQNDNSRIIVYTHILVAMHFLPKTKEDIELNRDCINHINGFKNDPRACNLQWVTKEENNRYARLIHEDEGIIEFPFYYKRESKWGGALNGASNGMATHTEAEARRVCELLEQGLSAEECAKYIVDNPKEFGKMVKWIKSIASRTRWKNVSKDYSF